MKCMECPDYKDCRRKNDLRRKRGKCAKAKGNYVPTNADRIRAMTDEELARFILNEFTTDAYGTLVHDKNLFFTENDMICWLQQPADQFRTDTKMVGGADHA